MPKDLVTKKCSLLGITFLGNSVYVIDVSVHGGGTYKVEVSHDNWAEDVIKCFGVRPLKLDGTFFGRDGAYGVYFSDFKPDLDSKNQDNQVFSIYMTMKQ